MGVRRTETRWIIGVLAFAAALFFLFPKTRDRPLSVVEAPFVWLSANVTELTHKAATGVGRVWTEYISLRDAREAAYALRVEKAQLLAKVAEYEAAVHRAYRLEALLVLKQETPTATVTARVIGGDSTRWFHSLLLDRGSRDGIHVGDGVITAVGVVGRVAMVTHHTAQVLAVNNRGCIIPSRLSNSRQSGILKGGPRPSELPKSGTDVPINPAFLALLKYVPRSVDIAIGERVVTSGLEGNFPAGVPVGSVSAVVRKTGEMFAKIYVTPGVSFSSLEEVLVVIDDPVEADADADVEVAQ